MGFYQKIIFDFMLRSTAIVKKKQKKLCWSSFYQAAWLKIYHETVFPFMLCIRLVFRIHVIYV